MLGKLATRRWFSNVPLLLAVLALCGHISCDCPLPERPFPGGTFTAHDDVDIEEATVAETLTILEFNCSEGYSLVGDSLIQCMDDGWTSELPFCADFRCSDVPFVVNALPVFEEGNDSELLVGSVVRYSCDDGYGLWNASASVQRCSLDKKTGKPFWEGELPYCIDIRCSDPPSVVNASFVFEHGDPSGPLVGSVVRYSCCAGYELRNPKASSLRCSIDMESRKTSWGGEEPYCVEKKDCTDPGTSPLGERFGECCSAGSTLSFLCSNDTYELVGDSDITCLSTGLWSARRPLCRPMYSYYCEFPDLTPHTRLRGYKKGDYFVPGEKAEVWCKPGYRCKGNAEVECGEGGLWTKEFGICKEVFCERPPPIENGKITQVTDTNRTSFPYGTDIHYVCDKGYRVEGGDSWRTCNGAGVWTGRRNPKCEVIRCPDPGVPENGIRSSSNFSVGSRIGFSCNTGNELLGSGELLCQAHGQWAGEPTRCNNPDNFCPDLGTPIRGSKNTSKYDMGTKVRFSCNRRAIMQGSEVRECLPDRTWSGTPTKCIGVYDFDNVARLQNALVMKMAEIKERDRLERERFDTASRILIPPSSPTNRTILYFAFDVSTSISKDNFAKSVDIAKAIVRLVGVSPDGTRVGAVTFASQATGIFLPLNHETVDDVLAALAAINHTGGSTSASSVLHFIRKEYIPVVHLQLPDEDIKSIILILTDGRANMGGTPKKEANLLKAEGVDIYCIGITGDPEKQVLYDIASKDPQTNQPYVFMLENYVTMDWLVHEITFGNANYSKCGLRKENVGVAVSRIVGGQEVTEPWPWMAALYLTEKGKSKKTLSCGGSVIHPRFILTAAHCMYFYKTDVQLEPSDITVKLGLVNVNDTENVQQLEVRRIHIHGSYFQKIFDYDAALLELKEPLNYSSTLLPICLPPKVIPADSPFYKPGSKVWMTGWGEIKMQDISHTKKSTPSKVLKEIQLLMQPQQTCLDSLEGHRSWANFTDRMFCAGTGEEMKDTCKGDSGGPAMQQHLDEKGFATWTQVGIISWGVGCGLEGKYGMYAHLHKLMPWVNKTIIENEKWNG